MSKSGLSTLNRWLGRKNKDKSIVNGKLSKSNTNLSISSTNINETSQLEYNRFTPLPAATTNAPFEQTFRITVLLPKDQLYVTRLGARVPLSKLLELVCDNKLLDAAKFEFRNPVDPSQVYGCDLTIGAVGLSEIRLCHKTESYDNFNSDEIIKLHRTSLIRESLSSSEFSSRNSKHTTKTTSPYSSTNSLNSMDSSALSYGRTPKLPLRTEPKVAAPPRKKRIAPRPPSQKAIPEKSPIIMETAHEEKEQETSIETPLANQDFSLSTPNLSSSTIVHSDINGNDCNGHAEDFNDLSSGNGSWNSNGYTEDTVLYAQIQKKNALNLNGQSNEDDSELNSNLPEPSPRKRIVQIKKKSIAPPAPPSSNSVYQDDAVSIASTNVSSLSTSTTPVGASNSLNNSLDQKEEDRECSEGKDNQLNNNLPTPLPRLCATSTTLLNVTNIEKDLKELEGEAEAKTKSNSNISKILLNRTPTPEPRSISCEPSEIEHNYEAQMVHFKQKSNEDDSVSKQADSGIGEPVPSPIPNSLTPTIANLDVKSSFESSSDDDDMVKVYNFKLGKTLVKPVSETKTLEELTVLNNGQNETDSDISTCLTLTPLKGTPSALADTSSCNFSILLSPPPNFADNKNVISFEMEVTPDAPITPKITERPILDFKILKREQDQQELKQAKEKHQIKLARTPSTPLDNIVNELSAVIQEKGLDSLIKKKESPQNIESAKPNTLSNFTINSIQQSNVEKSKETSSKIHATKTDCNNTNSSGSSSEPPTEARLLNIESSATVRTQRDCVETTDSSSPLSSPSSTRDEEKLYRKRNSVSSLKQRRSITRSDSFHTTASHNESLGLNKRTSSQLSLDQMAGHLNRRKSSSELSIGESPSLQSLVVIKTILNSRKNSSATSSEEEERDIEVNARISSDELKFTSLELKTTRSVEETREKFDNNAEFEIKQEKLGNETKSLSEIRENVPKEPPKIYHYSGPPSINFSTWSERPKSQVIIKNEGDYIFGIAKAAEKDNNHGKSIQKQIPNKPPLMTAKSATIHRMGIPEKDYKVPVLVKPIPDVIMHNESHKVKVTNSNMQMNGESALTTKHQSQNSSQTAANTNTLPRPALRPTVESVLRPQTQTIVNTCTLPRSNKQRFSTPVSINKAQILRSSSIKQANETEKIFLAPGPQLLRSSYAQQNQSIEKSYGCNAETAQAPFGQNTLRRTGLKEKILAKEEQETHAPIDTTNTHTPAFPSIQQKLLSNGDLRLSNQKFNNNFNTIIPSAKLHLNLKKTPTVTMPTNNQNLKTTSPYYSSSKFIPPLISKPVTPHTAPVLSTYNTFSLKNNSSHSPIPSPPALSVQLKPATPVSSPTSSDDPRDELLTAIRNFNREGLKRS